MSAAGGYDEYGFVPDFYDHVVPYRDRTDVGFFVDAARECGGPVLEVGCGTGRVLIPTARSGVSIAGLDLSSRMLAVCREKLAREPESVRSHARLVEGDMRGFDMDETFALATVPFRSFQHLLTAGDQLACLAAIRRHLAAGGRLVLDIFNPWLEMLVDPRLGIEHGDEPEFEMPDGRRVIRRQRTVACDRFEQVNRIELIYHVTHPGGRTERLVHDFRLRYLFRFEAEHLLTRSGFDVEHVYAGYDRSPYGSSYPGELILVARKAR